MKEEQASPSLLSASDVPCHMCDSPAIDVVSGYELFRRVTSDCQPWPRGGRLGVCRACGCVQKVIDKAWQLEAERIYDAYAIYQQSEGIEQMVFEESSGQASTRSVRLLERLRTHIQLPERGRLLDVGCGNGALLRAFGHLAPLWSLVGTELNDKYRAVVESIYGVEAFYTCAPYQVPGSFDLITVVHVLEHIPAPVEWLTHLESKLKPGGLLVIEVPDHDQNPFDLLIADHCTHFTAATLTWVIQRASYDLVSIAANWVPKELTAVARKAERRQICGTHHSPSKSFDLLIQSLQWLGAVVEVARQVAAKGKFGLFGTSIAATWIFSELEDAVSFFVDEDPHRIGKIYMGRPVYHPHEAPSDSHVFIALPTRFAENIQTRMRRLKFAPRYYVPPQFFT